MRIPNSAPKPLCLYDFLVGHNTSMTLTGWRRLVTDPNRACRVIAGVSLVALGASVGFNAVLWWRLDRTVPRSISTERLPLGTQVLPLEASTTSGDKLKIAASGALPTILYFFSTSCLWCERNWANVRALESRTRGNFVFIGISNSPDTGEFVYEKALPFRCLTSVSEDVLRRNHIGGTPRTIVLSANGQVIGDWIGAYTPEVQTNIERFFGVQLPGLDGGEKPPIRSADQRGVSGESARNR